MVLYALISRHWRLKSFLVQVFAFALLLAVINENLLRRFLMDIIADNRNIGYEFLLLAVPAYISCIFVAGTVVTFFSFQKKRLWKFQKKVRGPSGKPGTGCRENTQDGECGAKQPPN